MSKTKGNLKATSNASLNTGSRKAIHAEAEAAAPAKVATAGKITKGKNAPKAAGKGATAAKPTKAAAKQPKAEGTPAPRGTGTRFTSDQKITLVTKDCPHREAATVSINAWKLLQKAKTVGEYSEAYSAARAKGTEVAGNYLQWAAAKGHIKVA